MFLCKTIKQRKRCENAKKGNLSIFEKQKMPVFPKKHEL